MPEHSAGETKKPQTRTNWVLFVFLGVVVIGLFVMIGAWMSKSNDTTLEVGETALDFSLTSFDGEEFTLSDAKGKVVLINVWASWCVTCDDESFMLQQVWEELEPSGDYLFLGIDYVDTEKPALEFISSHGITYPNGPDLGSSISKKYMVSGVPETFLVDREGILRAIKIGPFDSAEEVLAFLSRADE